MEHQKSEALLLAEGLDTIADKLGAGHPNTLLALQEAANKLLRQHTRISALGLCRCMQSMWIGAQQRRKAKHSLL